MLVLWHFLINTTNTSYFKHCIPLLISEEARLRSFLRNAIFLHHTGAFINPQLPLCNLFYAINSHIIRVLLWNPSSHAINFKTWTLKSTAFQSLCHQVFQENSLRLEEMVCGCVCVCRMQTLFYPIKREKDIKDIFTETLYKKTTDVKSEGRFVS